MFSNMVLNVRKITFQILDTLNYFLGQKTGFCATAFICRRIGWWLGKILRWVQKIMSLPFRFFFSPLTDAGSRVNFAKSLILHGWMQSWYPMRRNSRSACSALKKHQDRWDLKGCCCGREVFSPIICSLAKIEHKASYTVHYTVANISSGTFFLNASEASYFRLRYCDWKVCDDNNFVPNSMK